MRKKTLQRTDLALESRELSLGDKQEVEGVKYRREEKSGTVIHFLEVLDKTGEENIGKPIGQYCTIELKELARREGESFENTAYVVAEELLSIMPESKGGTTLVVGLGNRNITPDAIGPYAAEATIVTRHLKERLPEDFKFFSPVAVISPGVLGTSGIESASYIKSICDDLSPELVIAVDALAARSLDRLCRTVQISDTGITPGSGVENSRAAINSEYLGVPVVAVGVPTVVDIVTILADLEAQQISETQESMIVTPRNIDSETECAGKLIGYAINLALHKDLSVGDIDMFIA